jgi:hypothetical protein
MTLNSISQLDTNTVLAYLLSLPVQRAKNQLYTQQQLSPRPIHKANLLNIAAKTLKQHP